jgi:hypothetical protein
MEALTQLIHHLWMCETFAAGGRLRLGYGQLLEEFHTGLEALVVFHTHDHQVAFPVGREIDGRIFLMAEGGDFPSFIAQGGDGFDNRHDGSLKNYFIKINTKF